MSGPCDNAHLVAWCWCKGTTQLDAHPSTNPMPIQSIHPTGTDGWLRLSMPHSCLDTLPASVHPVNPHAHPSTPLAKNTYTQGCINPDGASRFF
mmetsp:Transcript_45828/g.113904  ORF Transcript_45828/g.113904 Transcript_45828/m.113904 type:complete len:94 (+) Transcript_45828:751-1032(+)